MHVALENAAASWAAATPATGAEIAWALRRIGCESRLVGPEHLAVLRHGVPVARIPVTGTIRAATLRALLRTLGVRPEQLDEYLADPAGAHDS